MLAQVDRVLVAVEDRGAAAATWRALLDAATAGDATSEALNARITTMHAGTSAFELLEPLGPGPVATFLRTRGEGLLGAGFTTPAPGDFARHLEAAGVEHTRENQQIIVPASATGGLLAVVTPPAERRPAGLLGHLYEVTFVVEDWRAAAETVTRTFGLDASRYHEISSDRFAYDGVLTLFEPPARLDRIEVTRPRGEGAMRRFLDRRGPSLYMCFAEADDLAPLATRLRDHGARFEFSVPGDENRSLFIHPSALHGVLMGVSRTGRAWEWSGRPELAGASG